MLADDEVFAGAILDRLLHYATVLNMQGRPYRLKELELDAQVARQPTTQTMADPAVDLQPH